MAGAPEHAPLLGFARAVQAYSYARIQGYDIAQAERAAEAAYPPLRTPGATEYTLADVARASRGARQAAGALGDVLDNPPPQALANLARSYGLGAGGATPEGGTYRTITATVIYEAEIGSGRQLETGERVMSVQVDVPVGMPYAQVRQAVVDEAEWAVAAQGAGTGGTVLSVVVQTVIGQ